MQNRLRIWDDSEGSTLMTSHIPVTCHQNSNQLKGWKSASPINWINKSLFSYHGNPSIMRIKVQTIWRSWTLRKKLLGQSAPMTSRIRVPENLQFCVTLPVAHKFLHHLNPGLPSAYPGLMYYGLSGLRAMRINNESKQSSFDNLRSPSYSA